MPYIEKFQVENYRVLRDVTLTDLQPLNVVLGPNGCGKSTLFDVFGFLADALQTNVRKALEPRGRLRELRSRGVRKPMALTISYREADFGAANSPLITYHLAVDEVRGKPVVAKEYLRWTRSTRAGRPFNFLGACPIITLPR